MPDLIAISQGLNAIKATTDVLKTIMGLRDTAHLLDKTIELNQKILSVQAAFMDAQQEQATLIQTIRELEEEIARLKTWETEKQRYKLSKFYPGTLAYVSKEEHRHGEPVHHLCTNCYEDGKRSFLQATGRSDYGFQFLFCPNCKIELPIGNKLPEDIRNAR